jgi:hypothetical protein
LFLALLIRTQPGPACHPVNPGIHLRLLSCAIKPRNALEH